MINTAISLFDSSIPFFNGDELDNDDVHVCSALLDQSEEMIAKLSSLLSQDEYERAERFHSYITNTANHLSRRIRTTSY